MHISLPKEHADKIDSLSKLKNEVEMELQENLDQLSKVERNNEKIMGSFKRMETGLAENTAHMEKVIQNNEKVWFVFAPITKNCIRNHPQIRTNWVPTGGSRSPH